MSHGDKQTEIGSAPEGWDVVPFSQFVSIQRGHDLTARQRRSGSVPVMGSAGLNGFHDQAIQVGPGMVLGRSGASYGQAHWCETDFWPHNTALYVTDFLGNDPRFAYYLLRATDFSQHNSGGAQQSLNRNFIAGMLLARPPRPEQERIRRCLDDAEAVVAGLERVIAKKRLIKQGAMQDLLSARRRLPGFSGEWQRSSLGTLSKMRSGGTPNRSQAEYYGGPHAWVSISDMTASGKILTNTKESLTDLGLRNSAAIIFPEGTILFAMYASVGEVCISGTILSSSQAILGIEVGATLNGEFLYYWLKLNREKFSGMGQQGTQSNLNKALVQSIEVPLPPLDEQQTIAAVLTDMDAEIQTLESRLAKARAVKEGMMQNLLTGRVRLV